MIIFWILMCPMCMCVLVCVRTGGCPPSASGGEGVPPLQEEPADIGGDRGEEHPAGGDLRPQGHVGREGAQSQRAAEEGETVETYTTTNKGLDTPCDFNVFPFILMTS